MYMKKIVLIPFILSLSFSYSFSNDFMSSIADVVKSTLSDSRSPSVESSTIESTVGTLKKVIGLEKEKKSDKSLLDDIKDTLEIKEGENWGLPSVFGLNEKKKSTFLGSEILGDTLLGDMQETGTSFYKGFKTSGESAEFMSGVMYKGSKAYNTMFDMFDETPFNIFTEEEEETSVLDVFEGGNKLLDMFD